MRYSFRVIRPCTIGNLSVPPDSLVVLDDHAMETVVAIHLPYNAGAALGLVVDGAMTPVDGASAAYGARAPAPPRAPAPRILPFRRPPPKPTPA